MDIEIQWPIVIGLSIRLDKALMEGSISAIGIMAEQIMRCPLLRD